MMSIQSCSIMSCTALRSTDALRMVASNGNRTTNLRCLTLFKYGQSSRCWPTCILSKRQYCIAASQNIPLTKPVENRDCCNLRQCKHLSTHQTSHATTKIGQRSCSKEYQDGEAFKEGNLVPSWVALIAVFFSFGAASAIAVRQKVWDTGAKWDYEWDKEWRPTHDLDDDVGEAPGPFTRHIILIRHGQYENVGGANDETQGLTALGRSQAELTGQRLRSLLSGKRLVGIYHSNLKRARETAALIAHQLKNEHSAALVQDPLLAEGVPSMPVPPSATFKPSPEEVSTDSKRIEEAFRRYFYRSASYNSALYQHPPEASGTTSTSNDQRFPTEEYTVLVCHGNVIRYFFCRALQLPVFAWLRLATFNCGLTWISIDRKGFVSARHFGDVGHLDPASITYS